MNLMKPSDVVVAEKTYVSSSGSNISSKEPPPFVPVTAKKEPSYHEFIPIVKKSPVNSKKPPVDSNKSSVDSKSLKKLSSRRKAWSDTH